MVKERNFRKMAKQEYICTGRRVHSSMQKKLSARKIRMPFEAKKYRNARWRYYSGLKEMEIIARLKISFNFAGTRRAKL